MLLITVEPNLTYVAGDVIVVSLAAVDNFGNTDLTYNGNVNAAINPPNINFATLGGTASKTAVNGVVTFSDLTVNKNGNYELLFTSGTLISAVTTQFSVSGFPS